MSNQDLVIQDSYKCWQYRYVKSNGKPKDIEIIPNFKLSQPQELCKYFSFQDYNIEAFINKYFYGSHPLELNDPYDVNRDLISFDQDAYHFLFSYFGILSLTEYDLDPLMWSHYGSHKGFVIRYKLDKIPENFFGPFPIHYIKDFESINVKDPFLKFLIAATIKYKKHWKSEKEWRFILNSKERMELPSFLQNMLVDSDKTTQKRYFSFQNFFSIKEVILGYKIFMSNEVQMKVNSFGFDIATKSSDLQRFLSHLHNEQIKSSIIDLHPNKYSCFLKKQVSINKISDEYFQITYKK